MSHQIRNLVSHSVKRNYLKGPHVLLSFGSNLNLRPILSGLLLFIYVESLLCKMWLWPSRTSGLTVSLMQGEQFLNIRLNGNNQLRAQCLSSLSTLLQINLIRSQGLSLITLEIKGLLFTTWIRMKWILIKGPICKAYNSALGCGFYFCWPHGSC